MFRMHLLGVQEGDSMSYMDTYKQWCENPYFDETVREVMYLRLSGELSFLQIGNIMGKTETCPWQVSVS